MKKRIVYFGGTFDPPHAAHLEIGRAVLASGRADLVMYAPSYVPPHKRDRAITPFADRLAMTRLLVRGEPGLEATDFEDRIRLNPSYTLEVLRRYKHECPECDVAFVVGGDSLAELGTWYSARTLLEEFGVIVAPRTNVVLDWDALERTFGLVLTEKIRCGVLNSSFSEISSTFIRKKLEKNVFPDNIMNEAIKEYIREHGLYRIAESGEV